MSRLGRIIIIMQNKCLKNDTFSNHLFMAEWQPDELFGSLPSQAISFSILMLNNYIEKAYAVFPSSMFSLFCIFFKHVLTQYCNTYTSASQPFYGTFFFTIVTIAFPYKSLANLLNIRFDTLRARSVQKTSLRIY